MLCNKSPQHLVTLNMYYNLKIYLAASGSVSNKAVTVVLIGTLKIDWERN